MGVGGAFRAAGQEALAKLEGTTDLHGEAEIWFSSPLMLMDAMNFKQKCVCLPGVLPPPKKKKTRRDHTSDRSASAEVPRSQRPQRGGQPLFAPTGWFAPPFSTEGQL